MLRCFIGKQSLCAARHLPARQSGTITAAFFDELSAVFKQLMTLRHPVVVSGDFNVHVDQVNDTHALRLVQLLPSFGCIQRVAEPTRDADHTFDLVITRAATDIGNVCVGGMLAMRSSYLHSV